jgi:hypothetical protein
MKVVVVHGSNDNEDEAYEGGRENTRHWFSWLIKELNERNIEVSCELYPKDWNPNYYEWKNIFEKNKIDEETILIGHSAGCGFILKWLNENKIKVKKIILVAPYVMGIPEAPFLKDLNIQELDLKLKKYFDEMIIFYSEDDMDCIVHDAKFIHSKLGGKLIKFQNRGHFNLEDMGTNEFPELLEEILN